MSRVDLIVPTVPGREQSLRRCLDSFSRHGVNPIVIEDSPTCGAGWIKGLEQSTAPYVALIADDLELIGDPWPEACIEAVDKGLLPCPRVWTPDGSVESQGGDMNAFSHIVARHRKDWSEVDFTTVPFMGRDQVERIGMIPTQYACDTWVSYRGRQLGIKTVLRHGFDVTHYQEMAGRGAGMEQSQRDAIDTKLMFDRLEREEVAA